MASDLQKEVCAAHNLGMRFKKISAVFDKLPDRFKLRELLKLTGLKDGAAQRMAVGAVLYRDFKCINVELKGVRFWKKPEQQHGK